MRDTPSVFSLISGTPYPPKSDKIDTPPVKSGLETDLVYMSDVQTTPKNDMQYDSGPDECHKKQAGVLGFPLISEGGCPEKPYPGGVMSPSKMAQTTSGVSEKPDHEATGEIVSRETRPMGLHAKNELPLPIGIEKIVAPPSSPMGNDEDASHPIPFEDAYKLFLKEIWRSITPRTYDRLKVFRKAVDIIEATMAKEWPDHHPSLKDNLARVRGRLTVDLVNELMGVSVRAGLPSPSEFVRSWKALVGGPRSMWDGNKLIPYDRQTAAELRIKRLKAQGR